MFKQRTRIQFALGFSLFFDAATAQNALFLSTKPVSKSIQTPTLDLITHSDLFEMNAKALYEHAQEHSKAVFELHFQWGTQADWEIVLEPAKVHGEDFKFKLQTGENVAVATHITYKGYLKHDPNTKVRMTISDNYIFGLILDHDAQAFEMVQKTTQLSENEIFTLYKSNSIPLNQAMCGHSLKDTSPAQELLFNALPAPQELLLSNTYCPKLGVVLDWQGLAKAGSVSHFNADLQTIINIVNGYFAVFSVQYELNPVFVISASPNPWTDAPGNQSTLVQNFANWGFPNLTPTNYNCALLFTGTNMNGIGYAYYGQMCPSDVQRFGEIDYQYAQPITQRANLTTHELGHLWDARHTSTSSTYIMSPSIYNGTLQWDETASNVITNSVNVRFNNCLPKCSRLAVQWTHPIDNQVFTNLNAIALSANAAADGSVTNVSFWVNNTFIGTDNTNPYTLNWTPPAFADYTLKAIVTDNLGNTLSKSIVITVQKGARTTLIVPIRQSSDDAEQTISSGSMDLNSTDLELANEGGTSPQEVGMRFQSVNIPRNATITNAYIQFTTDETDSNPIALTIYGEDKANPLTFNSVTNNISSRVKTNISVPWSPAAWTTRGDTGIAQRTPNLNTLIQKIVNRVDWVPNNAMVLLVNGASKRTAASYDYSAAAAPVLHITYTTAPTGVEIAALQALNGMIFPNPFSNEVHFRFELLQSTPIQIDIFNALGQRVTSLVDKTFSAGQQEIHWRPTVAIPKGIYFLVMTDGQQRVMHKLVKNE